MRQLNIFFDIDLTLITSFQELRPYTREVFAALRSDGHTLYVWSAGGKEYAEHVVARHELGDLIEACFGKKDELPVAVQFAVDDLKEFVEPFGGYVVRPFVGYTAHDTELLDVYRRVHELAPRPEGHHPSVAPLLAQFPARMTTE